MAQFTESSIVIPQIVNSTEENGTLEFQIDNVDTSIVNSVRRTLLSDIPCFVFRTFPDSENQATINKNTTRFHNEILKQRLGCIPIHIKDLDTPVDNLSVIIKVKNDTDSIKFVTTKDFQIRDNTSGKFLSENEVNRIFPPCGPPSNGYILFVRLRPRISANIPGEEIDIEAKISISTSKESGMYNVCSTATYFMNPDAVKQNSEWGKIRNDMEQKGIEPDEIELNRQNWFIHDAKRIIKPNSFIFRVETVGVFTNLELIKKACTIVLDKLEKIGDIARQRQFEIISSKNTMPNCYDVIMKNVDYTVGKIIEYVLHEDFFQNKNKDNVSVINYVGYIKEHPHDEDTLLRISFANNVESTETINSLMEHASDVGITILKSIRDI